MGGFLRGLAHRLTSDVAELDAEDLGRRSRSEGLPAVSECRCGQPVELMGRLRSVQLCAGSATPVLQAELFDGSEPILLVWMGRRRIAGIEPGRVLKVRGRLARREEHKVLYNPYYELQ